MSKIKCIKIWRPGDDKCNNLEPFIKPLNNTKMEVIEIEDSLESYQKEVGTDCIQVVYPFPDDVAIICDDEGKLKDRAWVRALMYNKQIYDILVGTILIVGAKADDENFSSLTEDQIKLYFEQVLKDFTIITDGGYWDEQT